jgi:hypothetical protein
VVDLIGAPKGMARALALGAEKQQQIGFAASALLPRPATTHQAVVFCYTFTGNF